MTPLPPLPTAHEPAAAAPMPMPGANARLTQSHLGYAYGADTDAPSWNHDWRAFLGVGTVRLRRGEINLLEPTIGGRPMSQTALPIDAGKANANGESWVCLEAVPDADGKVTSASRREIVHFAAARADDIESFEPNLARWALCLILWLRKAPRELHQIRHFSGTYFRRLERPDRAVHLLL